MNVTLTVKTYVDRKGMLEAVKEASLKPLEEIAIRVKNRAKKSMKKGPRTKTDLAAYLPGPLKPFAKLGAFALYRAARAVGIPSKIVGQLLRDARQKMLKARKDQASPPGTPPHRQTDKLYKGLSAYIDKQKGVAKIDFGDAWYGRVHEQGSRKHPKRPIIMPAMLKESQKRPDEFKDLNLSATKAGRRMNRKKARTAGKRV